MSDRTRPLVAPEGGFTLLDIANAYRSGVFDGQAWPNVTPEEIGRAVDAYVKSVAVPITSAVVGPTGENRHE